MSNTKDYRPTIYTPPWYWDGEFPIRILDAHEHVVCSDMMPSGEANARLIAAAPELLEAAQDALDCITELSRQFPADKRWKRCVDASAKLGVAISKAEGNV